jgi:hypothetical protein
MPAKQQAVDVVRYVLLAIKVLYFSDLKNNRDDYNINGKAASGKSKSKIVKT